MQFALGENTFLRRELGTRDAGSSRRNYSTLAATLLFSSITTAPMTFYLSLNLTNTHGVLFLVFTTVSIYALLILSTFPYFLVSLCFTSYSPLFFYQERISPGFFTQTILGFKRDRNLKYATIKPRKSRTIIGRRLGIYSVCISSTQHSNINLRLLTKSEVDLLMAYWNAANPPASTEDQE